jgi:hypothetical protein
LAQSGPHRRPRRAPRFWGTLELGARAPAASACSPPRARAHTHKHMHAHTHTHIHTHTLLHTHTMHPRAPTRTHAPTRHVPGAAAGAPHGQHHRPGAVREVHGGVWGGGQLTAVAKFAAAGVARPRARRRRRGAERFLFSARLVASAAALLTDQTSPGAAGPQGAGPQPAQIFKRFRRSRFGWAARGRLDVLSRTLTARARAVRRAFSNSCIALASPPRLVYVWVTMASACGAGVGRTGSSAPAHGRPTAGCKGEAASSAAWLVQAHEGARRGGEDPLSAVLLNNEAKLRPALYKPLEAFTDLVSPSKVQPACCRRPGGGIWPSALSRRG